MGRIGVFRPGVVRCRPRGEGVGRGLERGYEMRRRGGGVMVENKPKG